MKHAGINGEAVQQGLPRGRRVPRCPAVGRGCVVDPLIAFPVIGPRHDNCQAERTGRRHGYDSEVGARKRGDTEKTDAGGRGGGGLKAVSAVARFDHPDLVSDHKYDVNSAVGGDVDLG